MPDHYSKWKLNKSEQKKVDDEEKQLVSQLLGAGKTQKEAQDQASAAKDLQVKALEIQIVLLHVVTNHGTNDKLNYDTFVLHSCRH